MCRTFNNDRTEAYARAEMGKIYAFRHCGYFCVEEKDSGVCIPSRRASTNLDTNSRQSSFFTLLEAASLERPLLAESGSSWLPV
jgi:hypothetical protein